MVPFAEVVLLTAMEYHRRDEGHGRDGNMLVKMNVEGIEEDELKEKLWVPQLKTIGDISTYHTY